MKYYNATLTGNTTICFKSYDSLYELRNELMNRNSILVKDVHGEELLIMAYNLITIRPSEGDW